MFWLRVIRGMRLSKLRTVLDTVKEKSGQGRATTFFDIAACALRYGAGYYDYQNFGFYALTAAERDTYVTRVRNKKILDRLNAKEFFAEFNDKTRFLEHFHSFLGREAYVLQTLSAQELAAFLQRNPVFFAKTAQGCGGKGVEQLSADAFPSKDALRQYLIERELQIVEAPIRQHPDLARLHPQSVNTLRIVTDCVKGQVYIAYVLLKIGRGGSCCDNTGQGGMFCRVDVPTAKICSVAVDDALCEYDRHPDTGVPFVGYPIPKLPEALSLVRRAALVIPQIGHIGWDVAITPNGAVIVEGNADPGVMCQFAPHWTEKQGLWRYYQKLLHL